MIPDLGQLGHVVYRMTSRVYKEIPFKGIYGGHSIPCYMHKARTVCNVCGESDERESVHAPDLYDHVYDLASIHAKKHQSVLTSHNVRTFFGEAK